MQLPDNSFKNLHARKIRELKVQTTHLGVIYDADIDFGETENIPKITKEDFNRLDKELNLPYIASRAETTSSHFTQTFQTLIWNSENRQCR